MYARGRTHSKLSCFVFILSLNTNRLTITFVYLFSLVYSVELKQKVNDRETNMNNTIHSAQNSIEMAIFRYDISHKYVIGSKAKRSKNGKQKALQICFACNIV